MTRNITQTRMMLCDNKHPPTMQQTRLKSIELKTHTISNSPKLHNKKKSDQEQDHTVIAHSTMKT